MYGYVYNKGQKQLNVLCWLCLWESLFIIMLMWDFEISSLTAVAVSGTEFILIEDKRYI